MMWLDKLKYQHENFFCMSKTISFKEGHTQNIVTAYSASRSHVFSRITSTENTVKLGIIINHMYK